MSHIWITSIFFEPRITRFSLINENCCTFRKRVVIVSKIMLIVMIKWLYESVKKSKFDVALLWKRTITVLCKMLVVVLKDNRCYEKSNARGLFIEISYATPVKLVKWEDHIRYLKSGKHVLVISKCEKRLFNVRGCVFGREGMPRW